MAKLGKIQGKTGGGKLKRSYFNVRGGNNDK